MLADVLDRDGGWAELAEAGLLGLAVPEAYGGEGLGLPEVGVLLRETGARATHLPVWETLCCGALVVAGAGTDEQKQALLPGVVSGEVLLTPAFREAGKPISGMPATTYADGTVSGRKIGVTFADRATRLLVPAMDGDTPVVALVDVSDPGVTLLESGSSARLHDAHGGPRRRHGRAARPGAPCSCSPSATSPGCASPRPASWPAPAT